MGTTHKARQKKPVRKSVASRPIAPAHNEGSSQSPVRATAVTQRIDRLLRLIIQIQCMRHSTAEALSTRLNVSRRTVFRDLKVLIDAGLPLTNVPGRGYQLDPEFEAPLQKLGAREALGLLLLDKIAEALPDQPLLSQAQEGVMRIVAQLPAAVRGFCQELLRNVSYSPGAARLDPAVPDRFLQLQQCIEERTVCRVRYRPVPPHEPFTGRVHPLHLHFHRHTWYLLAFSERHEEVRMFNLSRFVELETSDDAFAPMPFSIDDYLDGAWGVIPGGAKRDVAVRFSPRVTRNVTEINWHRSQQVEFHPDGSCTMRFHVNGLDEIKWWILGYGDQALVLEPAELRDEMTAMAQSMLQQYHGRSAADEPREHGDS